VESYFGKGEGGSGRTRGKKMNPVEKGPSLGEKDEGGRSVVGRRGEKENSR